MCIACGRAPAQTTVEGQGARALKYGVEPFGGKRWGFVVAASKNGRIVVLRRFHGSERPTFGHHGSSSVPADMALFDLEVGTERRISDVIEIDPERRRLLVVDGRAFLVDSKNGRWDPLDDGTLEQDENGGMRPRHAAFSPTGSRVGWITSQGGFSVLDFASGAGATFAAQGRLWRGWPRDDGSVVLAEVAAGTTGWPVLQTSCPCRWCTRFARSCSDSGFDGPKFELTNVSKAGQRSVGVWPEGSRGWLGPDNSGCEVRATSSQDELDLGPWRWSCK
jgi:hypothetical protein